MNGEAEIPLRAAAGLRDRELDAEELGPSVRIMRIDADAAGAVDYQFGKRQPRHLKLPVAYAGRPYGMVDQTFSAVFLHPRTSEIQCLATFGAIATRAILFGENWGGWIDEEGRRHQSADMAVQLRQWRAPIILEEFRNSLTVDFTVNIYARHLFHPDMRCFFREGRRLRHRVSLDFEYPTGRFITSRLSISDTDTGKTTYVYDVERFPLVWPAKAAAPAAPPKSAGANGRAPAQAAPKPEAAQAKAEAPPRGAPRESPHKGADASGRPSAEVHPKPRSSEKSESKSKPPKPEAPSKDLVKQPPSGRDRGRSPVPDSTHLSVHALIGLLSTEQDPNRRWRMIEPNLAMGRPERTYALISHDCDLIAERAVDWPAARIKAAFSGQPGTVMIALMTNWKVNQTLAVADENAESGRIIEWLREREIDRLLKLDLAPEIRTSSAARDWLGVDGRADAAAVKKAWRTLLGFLNADHGRAAERAIHRKKDEIAKRLHEARDFLTGKR